MLSFRPIVGRFARRVRGGLGECCSERAVCDELAQQDAGRSAHGARDEEREVHRAAHQSWSRGGITSRLGTSAANAPAGGTEGGTAVGAPPVNAVVPDSDEA